MLKDRLERAVAETPGLSQVGLARACKIKPPSVNDWFTGKTKSIKGQNLLNAAAYLGVRAEWLATGKGPMRGPEPYENLSPDASQPARLDAARLASAIQLARRSLENMGVDDFDAEGDAEIVAQAYVYLAAIGSALVTDGNVIDFTRAIRQGGASRNERATGTGSVGLVGGGARKAQAG